jgi:hypothetical protein
MARSAALIRNSVIAVTMIAVPLSVTQARHHAASPHKQRKSHSMTESYEAIKAKAKAANAALAAGRFADANALFDTAIVALGDRYRNAKTIDDTGMKLTLAKTEAAKGNMAGAANLKKSVVASRMAQFQQLHPAH